MLISIITVCYNSKDTIENTINSVLSQKYVDIEYLIIDGNSNDGTKEIIKSYKLKYNNIKFISEIDKGIYDAMNKGIKMSSGEIIGILNSDDYYIDEYVLNKIHSLFKEDNNLDSIYSNINYINRSYNSIILRKWISGDKKPFNKGWHPAHPAFFVRKYIYEKYGLFDLKYKLAADFEIMLRLLDKYKITTKYLNETIINMRVGGVTNKSIKNILIQNIECIKAFKNNKIKVNIFTYPIRRLYPKFINKYKRRGINE